MSPQVITDRGDRASGAGGKPGAVSCREANLAHEGRPQGMAMRWTAARRRKLAALLSEGLSFTQAAKRLGCSRGSVCWQTARHGIGRKPDPKLQPSGQPPKRPSTYRTTDWNECLVERWADRRKAA